MTFCSAPLHYLNHCIQNKPPGPEFKDVFQRGVKSSEAHSLWQQNKKLARSGGDMFHLQQSRQDKYNSSPTGHVSTQQSASIRGQLLSHLNYNQYLSTESPFLFTFSVFWMEYCQCPSKTFHSCHLILFKESVTELALFTTCRKCFVTTTTGQSQTTENTLKTVKKYMDVNDTNQPVWPSGVYMSWSVQKHCSVWILR